MQANVSRSWARIRTLSSGEQSLVGGTNSALLPAPAKQTLTGAGVFLRGAPFSTELGSSVSVFLLQANVGRSWARGRMLSSDERILIGGQHANITPTPAKQPLAGAGAFLRGAPLSTELRSSVFVFLLQANVSRSWARMRTMSSGERPLTGGTDISLAPAPAKAALVVAARPRTTQSQFCDYLMPTARNFGILCLRKQS